MTLWQCSRHVCYSAWLVCLLILSLQYHNVWCNKTPDTANNLDWDLKYSSLQNPSSYSKMLFLIWTNFWTQPIFNQQKSSISLLTSSPPRMGENERERLVSDSPSRLVPDSPSPVGGHPAYLYQQGSCNHSQVSLSFVDPNCSTTNYMVVHFTMKLYYWIWCTYSVI